MAVLTRKPYFLLQAESAKPVLSAGLPIEPKDTGPCYLPQAYLDMLDSSRPDHGKFIEMDAGEKKEDARAGTWKREGQTVTIETASSRPYKDGDDENTSQHKDQTFVTNLEQNSDGSITIMRDTSGAFDNNEPFRSSAVLVYDSSHMLRTKTVDDLSNWDDKTTGNGPESIHISTVTSYNDKGIIERQEHTSDSSNSSQSSNRQSIETYSASGDIETGIHDSTTVDTDPKTHEKKTTVIHLEKEYNAETGVPDVTGYKTITDGNGAVHKFNFKREDGSGNPIFEEEKNQQSSIGLEKPAGFRV